MTSGNRPRIEAHRCKGCGRCVAACPLRIPTLEVDGTRKHAGFTNLGDCDFCGRCAEACLFEAISLPLPDET